MKSRNNKNKKSEIIIYRLCRDKETKAEMRRQTKEYNLPQTELLMKYDYFKFLTKIIKECPENFALVCHDDIVLPIDIELRAQKAVANADKFYGSENWAVIGNSGIEMYTDEIIRYIKDPHTSVIPNKSIIPHVATHVDGNVMLLNIGNLRRELVKMPPEMTGFHLYDLILVVESYKKGLLSLVDSELYVIHKSKGNQIDFDRAKEGKSFQNYWKNSFINHSIKTINGDVYFNQNYSYLEKNKLDKRIDYYQCVKEAHLKSQQGNKQKKIIYIGIRSTFDRIPRLLRLLDTVYMLQSTVLDKAEIKVIVAANNLEYDKFTQNKPKIENYNPDLDIDCVYVKPEEGTFPRVSALKEITNRVQNNSLSYVWFVDDDDFVIPVHFEIIPELLNEKMIFIGDSLVFKEKWDEKSEANVPVKSIYKDILKGREYYKILTGDNFIPICSIIYPVGTLKPIFQEHSLIGDYYEDYIILLLAQKGSEVRSYPFSIAGISYHGENVSTLKNRQHWDYSYVSFMSEIVNSAYMPAIFNKFMEKVNLSNDDPAFIEFRGFTQGKIWKYLQIYRYWKIRLLGFNRHSRNSKRQSKSGTGRSLKGTQRL